MRIRLHFRQYVLGLAGAVAVASAAPALAATEIQLWHAMTGALNERIVGLTEEFNKSQSDYHVNPVYKGSYPEALNAGIAAFRAGTAPHILQVFEVGTATMMNAKGAIKPVEVMMKEAGEPFDRTAYVPAVAGYYATANGQLASFPFNSSTPVFYYNKDAFAKAGLDPEAPPKTWTELAVAAAKLKSSGQRCGYTTTWPSWIQLETFSAWHNVEYATKNNGFGGLDARLKINSPLHVRHIENLANLSKQGLFTYGGRGNAAVSRFFSGECAMLTESSSGYANIKKNATFKFGIASLPYYPDVAGAPQNTIIGGASLWVFANKTAPEYKGVAKFFSYLSKPEVQAKWHQETGYLPVTTAAYDLTRKSGFYKQNPGTDVSVEQMIVKITDKSRGVRLGFLPQIRDVTEEELENVWAGKQTAKQGLDRAVQRGDELLTRFERGNR
ncbi:sn-glycerol-3-phosphate ABC transporter substrate-binding protein UgpB [Pigmentiphaga aceris]|uniref:sn-glycerol-3-phosphate-binding periplasmic protein UgpB n=1 Tax=Pigmentiphaga aceris TaxID=1940612 RepID=A0A5C0AXT8_9BURK|nr:sn-glycerol-3-phosphate ABC transporter substrate-binding protein UgpB [Pigmentiphaga aceris]QEI05401.1 sn-glycerol-3-phosphate ABC transporter substrate-binding protein UgpB [Pigmentiphaga aceris]